MAYLKRHLAVMLVLLATIASALLVTWHLRLSADVADLLPDARGSSALRTYTRVFGGGDLGVVLVRGHSPRRVDLATKKATAALRNVKGINVVLSRISLNQRPQPSLAWAWASPRARKKLAHIVTSDGMKQRLEQTRLLLLAPGSASAAPALMRDPLRLSQVPFEDGVRVSSGVKANPGGTLSAQDGRARLVLMLSRKHALRGAEARSLVGAIDRALQPVRKAFPSVTLSLTGGHAVAAQTEQMIRRDLWLSGILSTILVAIAFIVTFRRARALLAILPPLALGTLWTTGAAAIGFSHLSGISVAFVAVVVGVGMDTGIHVYAAVRQARQDGLAATDAARRARRETGRPTLVAAAAAALAFWTLGLSQVPALRQFGFLCGTGELLTAVAILAITPGVGAWLERSPEAENKQARPFWLRRVLRALATPAAPWILAVAGVLPVALLISGYAPKVGDAVVAVRPAQLPALQTQQQVERLFKGGPGQWVVLLAGTSGNHVRQRADNLFEGLAADTKDTLSLDALTRLAPTKATQRRRLDERDKLDLPSRKQTLARELERVGFNPAKFTTAIEQFAQPGQKTQDALARPSPEASLLQARFLGHEGNKWWSVVYVRPTPGREQALRRRIHVLAPDARITGYARLDQSLREGLRHDLPRMGLAAFVLVAVAMGLSLRNARHWLAALAALGFEISWVLVGARMLGVPFHLYDAFVLPVLLGVTVDESMFLLQGSGAKEAWSMSAALAKHGRQITATAWTTAAGFAALIVCSFPGLRDMGKLGVAGVLLGWVASVIVVPLVAGHGRSARHVQ